MAETKKKVATKKTTKKTVSSKTATKKPTATKKAVSSKKSTNTKTVKNGGAQKATAIKKQDKSVEKIAEKKEHDIKNHEKANNNKSKNTWMIVSVILAILVIILVISIGAVYLSDNDNKALDNESSDNVTSLSTTTGVKLVIIEDETCTNCAVDTFAQQVKVNIVPDLVVEKVSYTSEEGKSILEKLASKQVPVYLFTENFDKVGNWSQFSGAFIPVTLDSGKYYMLNPQFIPTKVMIENPVITDSAIVIGDKNAPVTLIEFTDFECPYCAIAEGNPELVKQFSAQYPNYESPMPKVMEEYVDTGKVKVVFYNNPIASLHPQSRIAHNAVICANEQGMFEKYSQKLWEDRSTWINAENRTEQYKKYASDLGLDTTKFDECLDSLKYDSQIDEELNLAASYGVSGTPAFFIGKTFISGAQDFNVFKEAIESELSQ